MVAMIRKLRRNRSHPARRAFRASFLDLAPVFDFGSFLRSERRSDEVSIANSWRAIGESWENVCQTGRNMIQGHPEFLCNGER